MVGLSQKLPKARKHMLSYTMLQGRCSFSAILKLAARSTSKVPVAGSVSVHREQLPD